MTTRRLTAINNAGRKAREVAAMNAHDEIIRRGFREVAGRRGYRGQGRQIRYTRGNEVLVLSDYGPGEWSRYVLQYFRDGRKLSGGTAWKSILAKHVDSAEA